MNNFAVHLKLTQHKSTILQLKIFFLIKKKSCVIAIISSMLVSLTTGSQDEGRTISLQYLLIFVL